MSKKTEKLNKANQKFNIAESSYFTFNPPLSLLSGFILQKDVYTTNLLYANDRFSTRCLKKTLPFRSPLGRQPEDPTKCIQILRQNGIISNNTGNENIFYLFNSFKPKKLNQKKLKFPIPKGRISSVSLVDFYSKYRDKNARIKYIDDDLNITSHNGKKIYFNFKNKYIMNDNSTNTDNINQISKRKKQRPISCMNKNIFDIQNRMDNVYNLFSNRNMFMRQNISQFSKDKDKIPENKIKILGKDNLFTTQMDFSKSAVNRTGGNIKRVKSSFNNRRMLNFFSNLQYIEK